MQNKLSRKAQAEMEEITVEPPRGWLRLRLREIWSFRELLFFLVWRDLSVRYKQTVFGASWAIIQPVLTMIVFSVIFGKLAKLPSNGIPYPIFSYTALLPWQLFSRGISDAASSLVSNQNMISKTYFPRLILPASAVLAGLVDFAICFLVLLGMMAFYQVPFTWRVATLPAFILLALVTALGGGLWLAAFNVRYRDVKYITPFLTQFWLYATPVAYSSSLVPEQWRALYGLNPMAGVVDGFRWAMLGQSFELGGMFWVSLVAVLLLLVSGFIYFQHMELTFADLV
jgi:lipopolysaccharide transport system permease protein